MVKNLIALGDHGDTYATPDTDWLIEGGQYGAPLGWEYASLDDYADVYRGVITLYDNQGYAYTSLFLDPAVARWTLGGDFSDLHEEEDWTLVTKTPVQYNVGHIAVAEGDTVSPDGRFLVSMNKWAIDRFLNVGPFVGAESVQPAALCPSRPCYWQTH